MRARAALLALLASAGPAWPQDATKSGSPGPSIQERIDQGIGAAEVPSRPDELGELALPGPQASPDVSLQAPTSSGRLLTPLDAGDIASRIDKGLTAAGEESAIPVDHAFGAFQRGYFLTAFSLALDRAQSGDAPAQTLLGELLSRGLGVKQDLAAAADWYRLAAAGGDREAIYSLGRAYLEGLGVPEDLAKAADLFEQAAKAGHAVAAREFAYLLLQGKGREKNALLAAAHLRRAAGLGDMDAQYALAGLYAEGVGVVADEAQAARWFAEAARNGHGGAQVEYAIALFNGKGITADEAIAARWFREAARNDHPLAQVRLARILSEGRGLEKDLAEAAQWYLIAKNHGIEDQAMEDVLAELDQATLDEAAAAAQQWSGLREAPAVAATPAPAAGPSMDKSVE